MRLRPLCIAFIGIALVASLSRTCYCAEAVSPRFAGVVTYCDGQATLRRGHDLYTVVRGAGILVGDRIETGDGATLSVSMDSGPAISLGELTSLRITRHPKQWSITLDAGETRVVNDGQSNLSVDSGNTTLIVGRGIIQMDRIDSRTHFEVTAGTALCKTKSGGAWTIPSGTPYQMESNGHLQPLTAIDWSCDPQRIRLAAAEQTSPRLEPPVTESDLPQVESPSDRIAVPEPDATVDSNRSASPQTVDPLLMPLDDLLEEEEDEDELRLAQEAPPVTRSTEDDRTGFDSPFGTVLGTFTGSSSLSLGSLSSTTGSFAAGGLFADANQQTFQGMVVNGDGTPPDGSPFPGAIHLVTAERRLPFDNVQLNNAEVESIFGGTSGSKFFSIAVGPKPTGQVLTNFFTGTGVVPTVVDVPRFGDSLIFLDQYNIPDPAAPGSGGLISNIGLTGLIGPSPTGPVVIGAAPLEDTRANFNDGATFALGEFVVAKKDTNGITFGIRRSDQDRLIIKDPNGNDANDQVTPNSDTEFVETVDPRFLPQSPTVYIPDPDPFAPKSLNPRGTMYGDLNFRRRAAFTTLVADQLKDYAQRTGQTRFVVDGKIVDISGYQPGH